MSKPAESLTALERFDLESVYDAEVAPLMSKIIEICKQNKIPMFATFLYANDPEGEDGFCTTTMTFEKERPVPDELKELNRGFLATNGRSLRMRVTNADGTVEDTVVIG